MEKPILLRRTHSSNSVALTAIFTILNLTCILGQISDQDRPLELGDIMPLDRKSYDKMRPPKYKGNATEVLFHVTVMSLDTIDESSMTYTCDVFFAQSWKDNRLRLPDNMTSEYRLLPIEWLTEIWRPDSFFKNAKSVTFQRMTIPNHYIWLWKDKTILYMVKLTLVLSCPMHFKNYPHDTQECNLEIESISHTTDDLIFTWDPQMPLDVDKGIELPQLELISTKNSDCTTIYSTGKFTCLEVVFQFKRRLGYYLFHTYVPTCLIVIMSWISFWIKPEAVPARVTLGVTSLLTLSTQHANSQKSLPPVSYIKAIDVFMSGCTVFVFLSLMEYALVNIVMGDIADIEKSKSLGISNLILGSRGVPIRQRNGVIDHDEVMRISNKERRSLVHFFSYVAKQARDSKRRTMSSHRDHNLEASSEAGANGNASQQSSFEHHAHHHHHRGQTPPAHTCIHLRNSVDLSNHLDEAASQANDSAHHEEVSTTYFMNRDGCMETTTTSHQADPAAAMPSMTASSGGVAAPNLADGSLSAAIPLLAGNSQDLKSLVHDVHQKKQKEIRDLMKKKREKAVLVDRISRWLFPTSFILLNIVYWALFGDHDIW